MAFNVLKDTDDLVFRFVGIGNLKKIRNEVIQEIRKRELGESDLEEVEIISQTAAPNTKQSENNES
jgi:hypothetical protein